MTASDDSVSGGDAEIADVPGKDSLGGDFYLVGIGASAGGLEALKSFFAEMPVDSGLSFIIVQHLAPTHKSLMVELLSRVTMIPVSRAEDDVVPRPNHIYLIPPAHNLVLELGKLRLKPPPPAPALNLPIDIFFRSLAAECGERSVAVILSGTGSDGARGIRAVKEAGGMVMVQAEASAKFAGMPTSAIATGTADFVLPVEEMPGHLLNYARHVVTVRPGAELNPTPEVSSDLERICTILKESGGIDFHHYKTATLLRRVERRVNIAQLKSTGEYLRFLSQSKKEIATLAQELLIGVTKFFRDGESFEALRPLLRKKFANQRSGEVLRLWSAACSTGEEAYSLAMLCEDIRADGFEQVNFKVFATDVDRKALEFAGNGLYPKSVIADLPTDLVARYFQPEGNDHFRVTRTLRDRLIFARQDLLSDPPFTKIDALSCRNLLIYIKPETQRKLLSLFHFALRDNGILFLGSSETVGDLSTAFSTLSSRHRLYRKLAGRSVEVQISESVPALSDLSVRTPGLRYGIVEHSGRGSRRAGVDYIERQLIRNHVPPTVVINAQFRILYTQGAVDSILRLPEGTPNLDVLKMVSRDLSLAISTAANQALRDSKMVEFRAITHRQADGTDGFLRITAEPLESPQGEVETVVLHFYPDERPEKIVENSENFERDRELLARIQQLEGELQSTRESLQTSVEQQETANEELQAANEELLASNEELQSTNEELESVNEELYTVNAEYQDKIQEMTELTDDLENFTRSTDIGTIFFDKAQRIRRFTPAFAKVTGLTDADIGRSLKTFAHPVFQKILALYPQVSEGNRLCEERLVLEDNGGIFLIRVTPYEVEEQLVDGFVATLVDISNLTDVELELQAIFRAVDVGICITDEEGRFLEVNSAYCQIYGYRREELIGSAFTRVVPAEHRERAQQMHDAFIEKGEEIPGVWTVVDSEGILRRVAVQARLLKLSDGRRRKITVVSDLKRLRALLKTAGEEPGEALN